MKFSSNLAPELNVLVSRKLGPAKSPGNLAPLSPQNSQAGPSQGLSNRFHKNGKAGSSSTSLDSPTAKRQAGLSPVQEEYELLEYEWPDLPPLAQIRDALARGRISKGVDYLLPVDKTKNSVDGTFRTNLRAMFKEPYLADADTFDEDKIKKLAKHHFDTNTLPSVHRPKSDIVNTRDLSINQESAKYRLMYTQSAPSHGIFGRATTIDSLRQRSSLNFPLKQRLPPEAIKLKEEAERILKSVQEKDQDNEEEYNPELHDRQILNEQAMGKYRKSPDKRRPLQRQRTLPSREMMRNLASRGRTPPKTKSAKFRNYDELKNSEVPMKREMPSRLRSRHMSDARSEAVWDWLNKGEKITDFSYFLEVCS